MKKALFLCGLCLFSFKATDTTAKLELTKKQYDSVKGNFWVALFKIDSVKIALKLSGNNENLLKLLDDAQKAISENGNFIATVDTVFYPKQK